MAHAMNYEHATDFGGLGGLGGWIARVRKALTEYRLYRQTVEELEMLTDRELADLDITRFSIRDVAHDSVYGA